MPQKRMAARGQSAKLNKGPSPKKAVAAKAADKSKDLAKKAKPTGNGSANGKTVASAGKAAAVGLVAAVGKGLANAFAKGKPVGKVKVAKSAEPKGEIEKAKAALKKEKVSSVVKGAKATVAAKDTAPEVAEEAPKAEGKKRGRKISIDINPNEAASALSGKWNTLYKKAEQIESKPYNMRAAFEEKTAITHKVLGWGYILANRNDRLEVLFKDGIKYLISNYKPS